MSVADVMVLFTAIVPVKQFRRAKTRLSCDPLLRMHLAKAFARDVVSAAGHSCMIESVVIVSGETQYEIFGRADDFSLGRHAPDFDVHLVAERSRMTGNPLNNALWQGATWSGRNRPGRPVVVIPADLAAITVEALDEALKIASTVKAAYVLDAEGIGTTLLTALDALDLRSNYGANSGLRHRLAGYSALHGVDVRLRRDVDTLADLRSAMVLGVGPATHSVVRSLNLENPYRVPRRPS